MQDAIWFSDKRPDTPCVAVCSTTFDDVCRGCGRTVAEVAERVGLARKTVSDHLARMRADHEVRRVDDGRGHGRGGWFGDSEGHSEAARRGWDDRDDDRGGRSGGGRSRDDDRSSRSSRGRDDDDGRGRGRGGWFGDSEGHSEAARRGWEDRDDDRGGRSSRGRGRDDDDRGTGGGLREHRTVRPGH